MSALVSRQGIIVLWLATAGEDVGIGGAEAAKFASGRGRDDAGPCVTAGARPHVDRAEPLY